MQLKDKWRNLVKFKHVGRVSTEAGQAQTINFRYGPMQLQTGCTVLDAMCCWQTLTRPGNTLPWGVSVCPAEQFVTATGPGPAVTAGLIHAFVCRDRKRRRLHSPDQASHR